jgi:hypothetical protein
MANTRSRTAASEQPDIDIQLEQRDEMGQNDVPEEQGEPSATLPPENDEQQDAALNRRHAELVALIRVKRMQEDLVAMQAELAGDPQAERIQLAGLPIRNKHAASADHPEAPKA